MHHDQLGYCLENIFKVCTLFNVTTLMKEINVVSVWRPCFVQVLSTVCHVFVVSVWRPCFVRVLSTVCHVLLCLSGDHALCGSYRQCIV